MKNNFERLLTESTNWDKLITKAHYNDEDELVNELGDLEEKEKKGKLTAKDKKRIAEIAKSLK